MSAFGCARATAATWCRIWSTETCSVESKPRTFSATESPTRIASTPASSTTRAKGVSYAVTMTIGSSPARTLRPAIPGTVILSPIFQPPPSRASGAPGGGRSLSPSGRLLLPGDLGREVPEEIVPTATPADLDDIERNVVRRASQRPQLALGGDDASARRKPRTEGERDVHQEIVFTDRAGDL